MDEKYFSNTFGHVDQTNVLNVKITIQDGCVFSFRSSTQSDDARLQVSLQISCTPTS